MSEALRTWIEDLILRLQSVLDAIDKLSAVEVELDQVESVNAKLSAENEAASIRIRSLEEEIERLKGPPVKPEEPKPKPPVEPAHRVAFTVKNGIDQARVNEYVSVSIPLPQAWGVKFVDTLAVQGFPSGESGVPLLFPADIRPIAWWPDKSIQCVIAEFRANIPAKSEAGYELLVGVLAGTSPAPENPIKATWRTKEAHLVISSGNQSFSVDIAGVMDGYGIISKDTGGLETTFEGKSTRRQDLVNLRRFEIEYAGPLVAIVYVEAFTGQKFGPPPHNNVVVCRRYTFRAGSSLVQCREWIKWEGTWNGGAPRYMKDSGQKDGEGKPIFTNEPNAILGTLWRERFTLSSAPLKVTVQPTASPDTQNQFTTPSAASTDTIELRQNLRPHRLKQKGNAFTPYPRKWQTLWGEVQFLSGEAAAAGIISCETQRGTVTVGIKDMHRMEPCAVGVLGNTINLDLASDKFYLAHHQGAYQEYGIDVRGADQPAQDLMAIWAQLNHPLRGLCSVEHYNAAGVQSPLPAGHQNDSGILEDLDHALTSVCDNTLAKIEQEGIWGLMIRGLFPRDWGRWGVGTGELGYNPNPAPGHPQGFPVGVSGWDEAYMHGTWTDYWNVCRLAWDGAVRLNRPELIDSLLVPAALRMIHTQIVQGAPEDPWTYIGGAPYGYGMYRSDNNSSHQYWEALFAYYYLTGDQTVPQTIERAVKYETKQLLIHPKLGLSGRHPNQWIAAARFLAATSTVGFDKLGFDWNERFLTLMRTAIGRHYLSINPDLAVWTERPYVGGVANRTQQFFTIGHYDMENLWHFMLATGDAPVEYGLGEAKPSEILIKTARAVCTLGMTLKGNMKSNAAGPWVRLFDIGADGKTLTAGTEGVDYLFEDDIPALAAMVSRAALASDDPHLKKVSRALVEYSLSRALGKGWPMNKITGLQQARLGAAVAAELEIEARNKKGA